MPVTTLDPHTALIIVDLQHGLIGATPDFAVVVEHSRALAAEFRAHGLPVVLVTVNGTAPGRTERAPRSLDELPADFTRIVAELDEAPADIVVTKRTWGAFASTDLEAQLRARGVTHVVVTGVATGTGVESTARQAYEAGFNVTLPIDAMADPRAEAHEYSVTRVFPRLGETGTTHDVLMLLKGHA
jgi:nicotinamidase-related amidase